MGNFAYEHGPNRKHGESMPALTPNMIKVIAHTYKHNKIGNIPGTSAYCAKELIKRAEAKLKIRLFDRCRGRGLDSWTPRTEAIDQFAKLGLLGDRPTAGPR